MAWAIGAVALFALAAMAIGLLDLPGGLEGRAQVVDGDTFRLGEERVRLLDIDAPEHDQLCRDAEGRDWSCGEAATSYLRQILAEGDVICQDHGRDRYGRQLATCTLQGRDIGAQIVEAGLAVADWSYLAEQTRARTARRGLWQGAFDLPADWRREQADPEPQGGWLDWLGSLLSD